MHRRNEILKVKYYSALFILAGLLFSLVIPTPPRVSANIDPVEIGAGPYKDPITPRAGDGNTPLLFEINKGQTSSEAKFISRGRGYTLYLADTEAVFSLKTPAAAKNDVFRMRFAGANSAPAIEGRDEAVTKTNYYSGKTRVEDVPNYGRVTYTELYPGVDAIFYGNADNHLEYDFVIAPEASAGQIRLDFEGAEEVSVNEHGDLVIKTANAEIIQPKPFSYQEIEGAKLEVASRYVVSSENTVGFETGEYDHSKPLIIDPALKYLTYIGGSLADTVSDIDADPEGNAYITGEVNSLDFPVPNSRQASDESGIYVSKISPDGQTILFNTFLDGSRPDGEFATSIAVSPTGDVFIAGSVDSKDYPTTPTSFQPNKSICVPGLQCVFNSEVVVTRLNPNGNIIYSTYLGGAKEDIAGGIAVDSAGRAYVTGFTTSASGFPKKNEFQGFGVLYGEDVFVTVFNPEGTDIIYSTGFGGNSLDESKGIAIDADQNVYITGETGSNGTFPVKNSFQNTNGGGKDAFVAKFNPFAVGDASLIYSTFIGGGGTDIGQAIAVSSNGQAHITGITGSFDFPLKNAFDSTNQINEAFVTVVDSSGTQLANSSFLGGSSEDQGFDIAVRNNGVIFVAGTTLSSNFPVSQPFQTTRAGQEDAFITKLRFGTGIMWSSFLGGTRKEFDIDAAVEGNFVFVTGGTKSNNLATTAGVIRPTSNAVDDATTDGFVAKILDTHIDSVGVFRPTSSFLLTQSTTTVVSQQATFTSSLAGQKGISGDWNGDGVDSIGSFTNGTWKVRDSNFPLIALPAPFGFKTVTFGATGDLPVAGDWDGDGIDTPGVFRPSTGQFTLTDSTATSPSFASSITRATFGTAGDLPISGDWDGDGKDSIAVYRPTTGETFFTNDDLSTTAGVANVVSPGIDIVAFLGIAEDLPIGGDWNGDGSDSLGLWRPSTGEFILSDDNVGLRAVFVFGQTGDQPIVGDWDGRPNP
jgi:hypothetical protein